jgi:hypothetical protein
VYFPAVISEKKAPAWNAQGIEVEILFVRRWRTKRLQRIARFFSAAPKKMRPKYDGRNFSAVILALAEKPSGFTICF